MKINKCSMAQAVRKNEIPVGGVWTHPNGSCFFMRMHKESCHVSLDSGAVFTSEPNSLVTYYPNAALETGEPGPL